MQEFDVIARIKELCASRSLTYYRLAKEAEIPFSTLNTMLNKTSFPSVPSLMKLCDGFGITLAQFFSEYDESALLTNEQKVCLEHWSRLGEQEKGLSLAYMKGLADNMKRSE